MRLAPDYHGQVDQSEVIALSTLLESHGVLLRAVDKHFRQAAIVGTVASLVSVPGTIVNGQDFITVKDKYAGAEAIGGAVAGGGALIVAIPGVVAVSPEAAVALFMIGSVIAAAGIGWTIGVGVMDILQNSPPPPSTPSPDKTKSEVDSPDVPEGDDPNTIEIPNAVAIGDPPNGFDVDSVVTEVGNLAVDLIMADLPIGWDPDAGSRLPELGDGDLGGEGGGGGGGISFPA